MAKAADVSAEIEPLTGGRDIQLMYRIGLNSACEVVLVQPLTAAA